MVKRERIFRAWTEEGYCTPVFGRGYGQASLVIADQVVGRTLSEPWKPEPLTWHCEADSDVRPDLSTFPVSISCSKGAFSRLWPNGCVEFLPLPIAVEDAHWFMLRCMQHVDEIDLETSDISWSEITEDGATTRWVSEVYWVSVIGISAAKLDAFKLSISPWGWCYFTERFMNRYRALGLRGLYFEHCGYIVDKRADAVPPPARPVPRIEQAPRWPKSEEAPNEEVARFTQAGEVFLQARGLSASSEPSAVLAALAVEVEALRPSYGKLKPKVRKELLSGLAGAFGLLLRRQLHWNWLDLQVTSRAWDLGLASPNGSHALCLNQVMVRQLTSPEPSTIVLLFNMIAAGNLPEGQAGDHVAIG